MPAEQIAYLGPQGSYTHQATLNVFDEKKYDLYPANTIDDIFTAVQHDLTTFGVVPIENSTNGAVVMTLDLFADAEANHPDIVVCGEIYLPVHHCLLGRFPEGHDAEHDPTATTTADTSPSRGRDRTSSSGKLATPAPNGNLMSATTSGSATPTPGDPFPPHAASKPLTSLAHVKCVYSHPQAWGQCKTFLGTYLKTTDRSDATSTSKAALAAAEDETGTSAAVCSELAARIYGLDVLARNIEENGDNKTRFFVIRKEQPPRSLDTASDEGDGEVTEAEISIDETATTAALPTRPIAGTNEHSAPNNKSTTTTMEPAPKVRARKHKSLLHFTVPHNSPGALADALAVFKAHALNLSSINSRPSGEAAWHYIFFIEFWGRKGYDQAVDAALVQLGQVVESWRWLGGFEDMLSVAPETVAVAVDDEDENAGADAEASAADDGDGALTADGREAAKA